VDDPHALSTSADIGDRRRKLLDLLERLHRHKDAAYGDAWRKRGEIIAIFANMARKYDRLLIAFDEQRPAATEPLGDTIADLLVYTAKYLTWIAQEHPADFTHADLPLAPEQVSAARGADAVATLLDMLAGDHAVPPPATSADAWSTAQATFTRLERALMAQTLPEPPPDELLTFDAKARLAWRLAAELSWLLARLELGDPALMNKVRAEIATMDGTR